MELKTKGYPNYIFWLRGLWLFFYIVMIPTLLVLNVHSLKLSRQSTLICILIFFFLLPKLLPFGFKLINKIRPEKYQVKALFTVGVYEKKEIRLLFSPSYVPVLYLNEKPLKCSKTKILSRKERESTYEVGSLEKNVIEIKIRAISVIEGIYALTAKVDGLDITTTLLQSSS